MQKEIIQFVLEGRGKCHSKTVVGQTVLWKIEVSLKLAVWDKQIRLTQFMASLPHTF